MVLSPQELQEYEDCKSAIVETLLSSHIALHPRDLVQGAARIAGNSQARVSEAMWLLVKEGRIYLNRKRNFELVM